MGNSIIGWDYGFEGEATPLEVKGRLKQSRLLIGVSPYDDGPVAVKSTHIDIFGLDPRVPMALTIFRQPVLSTDTTATDPDLYLKSRLTAELEAWTLARGSDGKPIEIAPLNQERAWLNGGQLDSERNDGCELKTAAYGVRIKVKATMEAASLLEIVATLEARPDVALGCIELAEKIARAISVEWPSAEEMAERIYGT
jgi:hypothetical protein